MNKLPLILALSLSSFLHSPATLAQTTKPVAQFNTCPRSEWPQEALRKEQQGTVTLSFLIATSGAVLDRKVITSSGYELLDLAALNGMGKCTFTPGTENGIPVDAWATMQYVWKLEESTDEDEKLAFEHVQQKAQQGDADSQFNLSMHYIAGQGVAQDKDKALQWMRKAADQGLVPAQRTLALQMISPQRLAASPEESIMWLTKAATQSDAFSQYMLGIIFMAQRKPDQARPWMIKAVEQKFAPAQYVFANELINSGKTEVLAKGIDLLKQAATTDRNAQRRLAECYAQGKGVEQSDEQAAALYLKAATAGDNQSKMALSKLYAEGKGVVRDATQAKAWADAAIK